MLNDYTRTLLIITITVLLCLMVGVLVVDWITYFF